MKTSAKRIQPLTPHFFASLGAKITAMHASGCDVIRLDEGSPDLAPAPHIIEALARAAAAPSSHGYQPHRGPQALSLAWAEMYRREYGVELDPVTEMMPLLGSKEGIFHLLQAVLDPGDIVLIPDPGYITYTRGTLFAGGEPYYLPLLPENGYLPDLQAIPPDVAERARILWLNYPNNPTAATAPLKFFAEAVAFAQAYDLLVCHDAAYSQVTFTGVNAPSLLQTPGAKEVGLEFNTLSKSHNMAGWRVGAALGNPAAIRSLFTLKTNVDSGHFRPVMEAAVAAMTGEQEWCRRRNECYRRRAGAVVQTLNRLGMQAAMPAASLYVWSSIPKGWSSVDFATTILDAAHVSLTPGTLFGRYGEGYVRISFTAPLGRIEQAMERLEEWMEK